MTGWLDDTQAGLDASINFFEQSIGFNELVIAFEDAIAFKAYKYMKKHNIRKPILVITHEDEAYKQHWYRTAHEHGIEVIRFFIPMPCLVTQWQALHTIAPETTELNVLIYKHDSFEMTSSVKRRLTALQEELAHNNVAYVPHVVTCPDDIKALASTMKEHSSWLIIEDSFRPGWLNMWAELCRAKKAACVTGTLGAARRFPIAAGYDYRALSKHLHRILKELMASDAGPTHRRIEFAPEDFYAVILNGGLCLELGLSPHNAFALTHRLLPLDHAVDTARFLHLISLEEHQELDRAKKKRQELRSQEPTRSHE